MSKLSKLTKGDKLHVLHDGKELVLTITHIEIDNGTPMINFKTTGDANFFITTEFKRKKNKSRRSRILKGSNRGRGWSRGNHVIKK